MGRALDAGRSVTLVIGREWRDEHRLPLKEEFRRVLQVAPPAKAPLDHGLLTRALGVVRNGESIAGDISIEAAETRWIFTPREPWRAGPHDLLALDTLEDAAGNQIGRAFEVDNFETVDKSPDPQRILIPFVVATGGANVRR